MKVFIDTNVFVDILIHRDNIQYTVDSSMTISYLKSMGESIGAAAISIPTIAYAIKGVNPEEKRIKIKAVLEQVEILSSHKKHVEAALDGKWRDIEDAMQYACAVENSYDLIITRDVKDFKDSKIPVMSPAQFLAEVTQE